MIIIIRLIEFDVFSLGIDHLFDFSFCLQRWSVSFLPGDGGSLLACFCLHMSRSIYLLIIFLKDVIFP